MPSPRDKKLLPPVGHYIVGFLDVLGMKDELKKFHLIPPEQEEREEFDRMLRATVGKIFLVQWAVKRWQEMLVQQTQPLDAKQPHDETLQVWSEMIRQSTLDMQYWSDGVLYYSKIDTETHAPLGRTLIELFASTGLMLLVGLTYGISIRGAIDIAWAAEMAPKQIFGAAVAHAYELESTKAIWPRILVSGRTVELLKSAAAAENQHADKTYSFNAAICLKFLGRDSDGNWMLHVLGPNFRKYIPNPTFLELYLKARSFIERQIEVFHNPHQRDIKQKYVNLLAYFDEHPP